MHDNEHNMHDNEHNEHNMHLDIHNFPSDSNAHKKGKIMSCGKNKNVFSLFFLNIL